MVAVQDVAGGEVSTYPYDGEVVEKNKSVLSDALERDGK